MRLDSWKEIATYLGKGVTTVQRWEKQEGLPVHRQLHQSLASVFAYTHELDDWRESRKADPASEAVLPEETPETAAAPGPVSRRAWIGGGVVAASGLAAAALLRWRAKAPVARPLVEGSLNQNTPSLTADGRHILYTEVDTAAIRLRLYDRQNGGDRVLETFPIESRAAQGRISPDGAMIAFLTLAQGNLWKVHVRDREDGPTREIALLDGVGLAWAPDSSTLAMTSRPEEGGPVSVFAMHHLYGNRRRVTRPPATSWGDIDVAVSPDGVHLAVVRYATQGEGDVWLLSWDGRVERRLTNLRTWINGVTFTADGKEVVFCPVLKHRGRLHRVAIKGGEPGEIPSPGTRDVCMPSASAGVLVFEDQGFFPRLYRGRIEREAVADERPLTAVTAGGEYAAHSLDGKAIAWTQADGVWEGRAGAAPRRIVAYTNEKRWLAWSPDSRRLAMTARDGDDWRVYLVDVETGQMRRLTSDASQEGRPAWSPSGRYLYWRSERDGTSRYYRRQWPERPDEAEPVSPPATEGVPSGDDRYFYYINDEQRSRIYEVAVGGGAAPRALEHIPAVKPGQWFVRGGEIVYATTQESGKTTPVFGAAPAGGVPRLLCRLPMHPDTLHSLSISPDLTEAVWNRLELAEDVWIIEGFR
jgi:Tol biopolymer transport system component